MSAPRDRYQTPAEVPLLPAGEHPDAAVSRRQIIGWSARQGLRALSGLGSPLGSLAALLTRPEIQGAARSSTRSPASTPAFPTDPIPPFRKDCDENHST